MKAISQWLNTYIKSELGLYVIRKDYHVQRVLSHGAGGG